MLYYCTSFMPCFYLQFKAQEGHMSSYILVEWKQFASVVFAPFIFIHLHWQKWFCLKMELLDRLNAFVIISMHMKEHILQWKILQQHYSKRKKRCYKEIMKYILYLITSDQTLFIHSYNIEHVKTFGRRLFAKFKVFF